ncbi:innexin inx3-like [Planococcus citri]|uniref:innexin inx3-like n=1 Tax=Planococcus citri TaxID=170843 RepID=UPI0031F93E0B
MSVLALLENFKPIVKAFSVVEKPITDNTIFRLHYRITTIIFFVCCVFVTAYSLFGDPIQCVGSDDEGTTKVATTYCYLGYTYTLPNNQHSNVKLSGIGEHIDGEKKYHNYYRWIPIMLFLQGALFYIPHWIWKNWEDKRISQFTANIRGPISVVKQEHVKRLKELARYFAVESLHTHNTYALMYYFCEFLNFINVILNMVLIDSFLNGEFITYGTRVLQFTETIQENRTDPMIEIFPRITKCDFHKYGSSGTVQTHDFMCILALNNLNEKIYIFLWFWFIFLACISLFPILRSVALFLSPYVRDKVLKMHYSSKDKYRIEEVVQKSQIGDFFVWDLLGRNLCSKYYREFINELHALLIYKNGSEKNFEDVPENGTTYEETMCARRYIVYE